MNIPLLTVVIVTHDRPDDLRHCLLSVSHAVSSVAADVEVIVSIERSDRSSDNENVVATISKMSPWVKTRIVHNQFRPGQSGNTNTGLLHARGAYVHILHDDDQLLPSYGPTVVPYLRDSDCPIFHLANSWAPSNQEHEVQLSLRSARDYAIHLLPIGTVVPSLGIFQNNSECPIVMDEALQFVCDWDFFAQHIIHASARQRMISQVHQPVVAYRTTSASISGSTRGELLHYFEHIVLLRKMCLSQRLFENLYFTDGETSAFRQTTEAYRLARITRLLSQIPSLQLIRGPVDQTIDAIAQEVGERNSLLLADWQHQASELKKACRKLARWRLRRKMLRVAGLSRESDVRSVQQP